MRKNAETTNSHIKIKKDNRINTSGKNKMNMCRHIIICECRGMSIIISRLLAYKIAYIRIRFDIYSYPMVTQILSYLTEQRTVNFIELCLVIAISTRLVWLYCDSSTGHELGLYSRTFQKVLIDMA